MKTEVQLDDGKVTIIGTAHVSRESKAEVKNSIKDLEPDRVCVELDEKRYETLKEDSGWKDLNVVEAIRDGNGFLLFMNLILSIYQRRIGLENDMKPGEELMAAVEEAEKNNIPFSLVDRDINETFRKALDQLSLWEKLKLVSSAFVAGEETDIEDLKEKKMLESIIEDLEEEFPSIKETFLDDRNRFMAKKILEEDFNHALVVVGAAHVEGLAEELKKGTESEENVKPKSKIDIPWIKVLKYGMPTFIIAMLAYSFYKIGFSTGVELTGSWILINGILAMLGAIIARSHVSTWIISFIAAPLTSLDPALGAGMVASYAEGKFYPPKVDELENIGQISNYSELWSNQASRILLTFVFVTMGSAAATFIAAFHIFSSISF